MFELVRAFETAKSEKNPILRLFYVRHTRRKLKTVFFDKFDIYNMNLDKGLLLEFIQYYNCTKENGVNLLYPFINKVDTEKEIISIRYYYFDVNLKMIGNSYNIDVDCMLDGQNSVNFLSDSEMIHGTCFRPIFLMAIYNYCVTYIYGFNSKLYIDDNKYLKELFNMC